MNRTTWKPLLTGKLLARAQESLAAITESLLSGAPPENPNNLGTTIARMTEASLASGYTGQALFYGYLSQSGDRDQAADVCLKLLDRAIDITSTTYMAPSLYSGFPGVIWAANHLAGRLYPPEEDDSFLETDDALFAFIQRTQPTSNFDLIGGLVGIGVYALERLPRESGRQCLEAIVGKLADASENSPSGISWRTPPALLSVDQREQYPQGYFNLGMAHGVPGVVGLLAALWSAGISPEKTGPLLEGGVSWILGQSLPPESISRFPVWQCDGHELIPARLAWCYGDPGVAAALLWAAEAMGRSDWRNEALATARRAALRSSSNSGVQDAGLCHGSAGVAHIFNRLFQASGEKELRRAALFWYEKLLEARQPGQGYGGYLARLTSEDGSRWEKDPGFLTGTAGIGLALLAATTSVEPDWDRVLLTSIPARDT